MDTIEEITVGEVKEKFEEIKNIGWRDKDRIKQKWIGDVLFESERLGSMIDFFKYLMCNHMGMWVEASLRKIFSSGCKRNV